jgi:O-methyltransferase
MIDPVRHVPVEQDADGDGFLGRQMSPEELARDFNRAVRAISRAHKTVSWGDRLLTLDKVCGFREDPLFMRAFEEIRGSHEYDQYNGPDHIVWRLNTLLWAAKCSLAVNGIFVECGVFKGDMSWVIGRAIGFENIPVFLLYDSFEGFSPRYSSAEDFPDNPGFFHFANQVYAQAGLFAYVRKRFEAFPNVRVIRGFLPESLGTPVPHGIGYLHIDLNSPRAEKSSS